MILQFFSKFFINFFIKRIYVLILICVWDGHLKLWATENLQNSIFGGYYGESGQYIKNRMSAHRHTACKIWSLRFLWYWRNVWMEMIDGWTWLNGFFLPRWSRIYIYIHRISTVFAKFLIVVIVFGFFDNTLNWIDDIFETIIGSKHSKPFSISNFQYLKLSKMSLCCDKSRFLW